MSYFIVAIVCYGFGIVTSASIYLYLNRTRPAAVDSAEDAVRKL